MPKKNIENPIEDSTDTDTEFKKDDFINIGYDAGDKEVAPIEEQEKGKNVSLKKSEDIRNEGGEIKERYKQDQKKEDEKNKAIELAKLKNDQAISSFIDSVQKCTDNIQKNEEEAKKIKCKINLLAEILSEVRKNHPRSSNKEGTNKLLEMINEKLSLASINPHALKDFTKLIEGQTVGFLKGKKELNKIKSEFLEKKDKQGKTVVEYCNELEKNLANIPEKVNFTQQDAFELETASKIESLSEKFENLNENFKKSLPDNLPVTEEYLKRILQQTIKEGLKIPEKRLSEVVSVGKDSKRSTLLRVMPKAEEIYRNLFRDY